MNPEIGSPNWFVMSWRPAPEDQVILIQGLPGLAGTITLSPSETISLAAWLLAFSNRKEQFKTLLEEIEV